MSKTDSKCAQPLPRRVSLRLRNRLRQNHAMRTAQTTKRHHNAMSDLEWEYMTVKVCAVRGILSLDVSQAFSLLEARRLPLRSRGQMRSSTDNSDDVQSREVDKEK